jgi:hypothetical protein
MRQQQHGAGHTHCHSSVRPSVRTVLKCTHIIHASILPSLPHPPSRHLFPLLSFSTLFFPFLPSSSFLSPLYIVTICADSSAHTHDMQIPPTISPQLFSSLLISSTTLLHHPTPSDINMSHTQSKHQCANH